MTTKKTQRVQTRITERLKERFTKALEQEGLTESEFITSRIEQFCREVESKSKEDDEK